MSFIVRLFQVRGPVEFLLKLSALLLVIGGVNHFRDFVLNDPPHNSFANNLLDGAFVGLPLAAIGLLLVAHLVRLQTELEFLANHDPLTGLLNRRSFLQDAERLIAQDEAALLMLDLDHFKRINDTLGHHQGDTCLIQVAHFLKKHTRSTDLVARLGGEEFGIILPQTGLEDAMDIATRLAEGFCFEPDAPAKARVATMSVGVVASVQESDLDDLIKSADTAMYAAKSAGRAQAKLWHAPPQMQGVSQPA